MHSALLQGQPDVSYSFYFMVANRFAPFEDLASRLLPTLDPGGDGAHDHAHLERVWLNVQQIRAQEGGDFEILAASVLLHDCVCLPKNSPNRSRASHLAAVRARFILQSLNWASKRVDIVAGAIEAHSYSGGLEPHTLEGRILQDADRLDAIGFVGIARCFYTAGRLSSQLYDPSDPRGTERELNDSLFALDHFPKKLLLLAEGFKTTTGQRLAHVRHEVLQQFYQGIMSEISNAV
jgi:uncharacterized protein